MASIFGDRPRTPRVLGFEFRVQGFGFQVFGMGFRTLSLGLNVWGCGFRGCFCCCSSVRQLMHLARLSDRGRLCEEGPAWGILKMARHG